MGEKRSQDVLAGMAAALIDFYRACSSCFFPRCRYIPSCSEYARQAILGAGLFKGGWLAVRRLARCHPLGGWGYDPIPHSDSTCKKI
jgi:putative membrane protein insertion efficiency factor